ncbi:hypothetical protein BU25DRAFT_347140, partial [Macroventuria anomochaeta]
IARITAGFLGSTVGIARSAIVQCIIYNAGRCYSYPLACDASDGGIIPWRVHVMLQFPAYTLFALSEALFAIATGEYTYTKAQESSKSLVTALNLYTVTVASALSIAVSRAAKGPHLTTLYACLAGLYCLTTVLTRVSFGKYKKLEHELFDLDTADSRY